MDNELAFPLFLLLLVVVVALFFYWLYSSLFAATSSSSASWKESWDLGNYTTALGLRQGKVKPKEGFTNKNIVTVNQTTYSTTADGRALVVIRPNLYFDFVGMNIVDIDYNTAERIYEITFLNRAGKQFSFVTKYKEIPAIHSTFFTQDTLSNLTGSYAPFSYTTDWQASSPNVQVISIPYVDLNSVQNTYLLVFESSKSFSLLSANLFTANVSNQYSYNTLTIDPDPDFIVSTANISNESITPSASSAGGLPFLYSQPSVKLGLVAKNAATLLYKRSIANPHYYYVTDAGTKTETKVYPVLDYITPFVYFNPANGDLIVLDGKFYILDVASDTFKATTTWNTLPIPDVQVETDTTFAGMVKTTQVKRYRRPMNGSVFLTDYLDKSTLNYEVFVAGSPPADREMGISSKPYSISTTLTSTPSFSISVANSVLERRLVYHLSFENMSVLVVVGRGDKNVEVEKILMYESGKNKNTDLIANSFEVTPSQYSKYQNPEAIDKTSTDAATKSSDSSNSSSSGSSDTGTESSSLTGEGLSALEKKAVYDMVAALIFSKDAYSTASGYTTKNCPACQVTTAKDEKKLVDAVKDKIVDRINKTEETKNQATTTTTKSSSSAATETKSSSNTTSSSLPSYESQSETAARFASTAPQTTTTDDNPNKATVADPTDETKNTGKLSSLATTKTYNTPKKDSSSKSNPLPLPGNNPIDTKAHPVKQPSTALTSSMIDSYLRRPPNPNYKSPMPVAFDFSKIGWQT